MGRSDAWLRERLGVMMNRRMFLKAATATAGACTVCGGAVYAFARDADVLDDHYGGTEKALVTRFGNADASAMMGDIRHQCGTLAVEAPYIGGEDNMFTEWLTYGVYYLAVYRVLEARGQSVQEVGKLIFDVFQAMADYPKWLVRLIGGFKYSDRYIGRLRDAVANTQARRYPGDWLATFVEGEGFDYGIDIAECGICKFYREQGAEELAPYLCLSDYVVSDAFDRGLVRHKTLAEGADVCDFRFKKGRETYVRPLRLGWPPRFLNEGA